MENKFELHIEGDVIESTNLDYLKRTARIANAPYFICLTFQSKMNIIVDNKKNAGKKPKLSNEDIDKIRTRYREGRGTLRTLSDQYHVSMNTIHDALHKPILPDREMDTDSGALPLKKGRRNKLSEKEVEDMCRMLDRGYHVTVIAKRYNVCTDTIKKIYNSYQSV